MVDSDEVLADGRVWTFTTGQRITDSQAETAVARRLTIEGMAAGPLPFLGV